jgi:hypothetical protein
VAILKRKFGEKYARNPAQEFGFDPKFRKNFQQQISAD